jgi:hypothetical protein
VLRKPLRSPRPLRWTVSVPRQRRTLGADVLYRCDVRSPQSIPCRAGRGASARRFYIPANTRRNAVRAEFLCSPPPEPDSGCGRLVSLRRTLAAVCLWPRGAWSFRTAMCFRSAGILPAFTIRMGRGSRPCRTFFNHGRDARATVNPAVRRRGLWRASKNSSLCVLRVLCGERPLHRVSDGRWARTVCVVAAYAHRNLSLAARGVELPRGGSTRSDTGRPASHQPLGPQLPV